MVFGFVSTIITSLKEKLCKESNFRFIFYIEKNNKKEFFLIGSDEDKLNKIKYFPLTPITKFDDEKNKYEYVNKCITGAIYYFKSNIDRCLQDTENIEFINICKNQFNINNAEIWKLAKNIGFESEKSLQTILSDQSDETYKIILQQIENYQNLYK